MSVNSVNSQMTILLRSSISSKKNGKKISPELGFGGFSDVSSSMLAAEQTYSQEVLLLWKQLVVCQCPQCVSAVSAPPVTSAKTHTPTPKHILTHTHTAGGHTQTQAHAHQKLYTAAHDAISFSFWLSSSCCLSDTHKHTHAYTFGTQRKARWAPTAPHPLHQPLLPQQQVSSRPPPAAFCQRWTTGVFKAKHTHTQSRQGRPGLQRWWWLLIL